MLQVGSDALVVHIGLVVLTRTLAHRDILQFWNLLHGQIWPNFAEALPFQSMWVSIASPSRAACHAIALETMLRTHLRSASYTLNRQHLQMTMPLKIQYSQGTMVWIHLRCRGTPAYSADQASIGQRWRVTVYGEHPLPSLSRHDTASLCAYEMGRQTVLWVSPVV